VGINIDRRKEADLALLGAKAVLVVDADAEGGLTPSKDTSLLEEDVDDDVDDTILAPVKEVSDDDRIHGGNDGVGPPNTNPCVATGPSPPPPPPTPLPPSLPFIKPPDGKLVPKPGGN
jgi:hypothetical protein